MARAAATSTLVVLFAACGGGGGGGGTAPVGTTTTGATPALNVATFTSVAMVGELLTYTADTSNLTYSYTITDSQYGLTGKTASGTLTPNSDGTYSLSGIDNAVIAVLPDGLMLGAINENLNGTPTTIPIIGVSNPVTDIAAVAGTYNYVKRGCLGEACDTGYGTIQITSAGTWVLCPRGELSAGCAESTKSGTVGTVGTGKWQLIENGAVIGTAIASTSNAGGTIFVDLTDHRTDGFGVGILVGSLQQSLNAAQTQGDWIAATTTGQWATFASSGTQINYKTLNGVPYTSANTFTVNEPWKGMAAAIGGSVLFAGTGLYMYENNGGYAEIGVKIR